MEGRHNKKASPAATEDAPFKYSQFGDDALLNRQDSARLQPQEPGGELPLDKTDESESDHEPDILKLYTREIFREPPLRNGEDIVLFNRWKDHGDVAAFQRLVKACLRSVAIRAKNFSGDDDSQILDLLQEGAIALLNAMEDFDPERGVPFLGYALGAAKSKAKGNAKSKVSKVRGAFLDFTRRNRNVIRFPREKRTRDEQLRFDAPRSSWRVQSLDAAIDDGDSDGEFTLYDVVSHGVDDPNLPPPPPSPEDIAAQHQERDRVKAAVAELPERLRKVIELRWFGSDKRTLDAVGCDLGLSHEGVRKIEEQAFASLRKSLRRAA